MKARVSTLLWLAAVSGGLLAASSAHAGVFDDDEARKAVLQLRDQFNGFQATASQRIDQSSRQQLDMQNQLEGLRQEVARLRGQNEVLQNTVDTLQKQQKDYYADLDARLKKFEPQQVTVDGKEGLAQPTEKPEYDAALKQFQSGDFKGAGNAFSAFAKKYPQSPYLPLAQFWLGNSLYAQRDYKGSTFVLQNMVQQFPTHAKVPDAMIAIANNQMESGQKAAAKKTLETVVSKYPGTEGAQAASNRLKTLK
ncbi:MULTISPECIES: tol-pal system protein YbgF [unclassified Cupriavidus]|uniref:tol-pal system protein YbgF n=1 Tax=unclassified Cupriavidus TaxID=2640874 RepID=UPI001C0055F4|nr:MULTISPECIES: tol-pal system protein YbgF [unclassified Cupriavidus]MCA3185212.1 tol-pal system protein YbgF [Cupriavidus sp.]MCA3192779.1 tol-pal system protein YbgF [Cupriavidus sp.]MCA3194980.1 tol-pal system protein YbgF [Cupriavidus sp.]MCA3203950.1 tol-pal system protein YbgF [Cupriavidus sp.]MCA3205709.1 tol-pal system protein YbgF [Cupriavidus sp.]